MYELREPRKVCKISFRPRPEENLAAPDCPTDYTFEGSNSKQFNTSSVLLLNITNHPACIPGKVVTQPFKNEKSFKYYRLNIIDVPGRPTSTQKFAVISDVRFYGQENDCL